MSETKPDILVAGLICLDVIPSFPEGAQLSLADVMVPGKLTDMDGIVISTGGPTTNTGLTLHRLGFPATIAGKISDDHFGKIIVDIISQYGKSMTEKMIVAPGYCSSYTVIINLPGVDRIFLHSASVNNTFCAADVPDSAFDGIRLMHFGYPPIMKMFYENGGIETATLMRRAKEHGITTSVDMSRPDPDAPAGRMDWRVNMKNFLPYVDVFAPSVDEIIFMLDRPKFDRLCAQAGEGNMASFLSIDEVASVADELLAMGPAVVCLKLGDQGFYCKATSDAARLAAMGPLTPKDAGAWLGREYACPCRLANVVGTTGSGDATVAGFLGALYKGMRMDEAAVRAVAVGACSVEGRDSNSSVPSWEKVTERLEKGWAELPSRVVTEAWPLTPAGARQRP